MQRAGEAIDEVRRQVLFRAGAEPRAVVPGRRWLLLRMLFRLSAEERRDIGSLLVANRTLMGAYTVKEQLRDVLPADTRSDMVLGSTAQRARGSKGTESVCCWAATARSFVRAALIARRTFLRVLKLWM